MDINALKSEFPKERIHWRAQSVTKDGSKAMALAYIDARDVMERLDDVCGAENWQCEYSHAEIKTICRIGIRVNDEWIWKADGAGATQVEAEKGAISDAFKRAAVKWGIGRYLYDIPAPWVPCECSEWNGKKQWKKWKADPWTYVKGNSASKTDDARALFQSLASEIKAHHTEDDLSRLGRDAEFRGKFERLPVDWQDDIRSQYADRLAEVRASVPAAVQNMLAG